MKRNSKRFLALFLSLAMTITPCALTQAEEASVSLGVVEAAADTDSKSEAEDQNIYAKSEAEEKTSEVEEADSDENAGENEEKSSEESSAVVPAETSASAPTETVTPVPTESITPTPVETDAETPAVSDKTDAIVSPEVKPDGSDIIIDKPDAAGKFDEFKISSSSAKRTGDVIQVTLITETDVYDALYLGGVEDAVADPENVCNGTANGTGYTFVFDVPASENDQVYQIALHHKEDNKWYQYENAGEFTITIPGIKEETPSVNPDVTPGPTITPAPTTTPVPTVTPAEGTCSNGIYNVDVNSSSTMFRIVSCVLTSKNGKMTAVLTLSGTGYDYLYVGTKEQAAAADASSWIPFVVDSEGKYTYEIPVEKLDQGIAVAAYSHKNQIWYDRTLTFSSSTLNKVGDIPEEPNPETCSSGIYKVTVDSSATMFRVVDCTLTSKNGKMTAVLTLSGTGYDYLYLGTKEQAAAADSSSWIPYVADSEGKYTYEVPVESLDQGIAVAAFSHKNQIWYDRTLTFKSETLNKIGEVQDDQPETPTENPEVTPAPNVTPIPSTTPAPSATPTPKPTATPKPDKNPDKESKYESDLSGGTSAVNSSTALKDGTYTPDSFSWSGGTGKVTISCNKVTVTNGQAYATIVFSSEYYGYVKANGNTYYGNCGGGTSTFTIPVALNQNNSIIGMTTRMSQAHEITYTIYVALKGADTPKKTDKENPADKNSMLSTGNKKLDDAAPEITGLEYKSETTLEHAKYFKMYQYDKGITLLEIDMTTDTARKAENAEKENSEGENPDVANTDTEDTNVENTNAENADTETADAETTDTENADVKKSEETAAGTEKLYLGNVVKYLLVPEGAVIPAGLDKDVIVVNLPVESTYVASEDAFKTLDKLSLTDTITCLGLGESDLTAKILGDATADTMISDAGSYDETDFKQLVKNKCTFAILPADLLPSEETEVEEKTELLKDMAEKYTTLKIPFIVDRSADEKDNAAKEEWEKVYTAILGTDNSEE